MSGETINNWSWKRTAFLIFVFFTCYPLIYLPQFYLGKTFAQNFNDAPWSAIIVRQFFDAYLWALITPTVFWLGHRFSVGRSNILKNISILMFFNICLGTLHALIRLSVSEFLWSGAGFDIRYMGRYLNSITYDIILCTGISIFYQAIEYARKYQNGEFRLQQAELQSLKTQLHPHFLFNTLNAISALNTRDPETANRTIAQLSDLLRVSLKSGKSQEITLKEELDFLRKYVQIQQTLLQERLKVEWKIDPFTLDALVPNMILQPLVENSIRHGISNLADGGQIEISAHRQNGTLLLEVRDNGAGFAEDSNSVCRGIGISNTKARLRHLYGEAHRFSLQNLPEGGVGVGLGIPFKERIEEN